MNMPPIDATDATAGGSLSVTVEVRNLWRLRLGCYLLGLVARLLRCSLVVTSREGIGLGRRDVSHS